MATAQPFTALGRGNGFPFCVYRLPDAVFPVEGVLDITIAEYNAEYGSEFGFLSSGLGFSGPIDPSDFYKLMPLYWNLLSVDVSATAEWADEHESFSATLNGTLEPTVARQPWQRVCNISAQSLTYAETGKSAIFRPFGSPPILFNSAQDAYYVSFLSQSFFSTQIGSTAGTLTRRTKEAIDSSTELDFGMTMLGETIPFWWGQYTQNNSGVTSGSGSLTLTPNFYTYD